MCPSLSYLSRSLADRWGTTVDFTTSFLHPSRFSAFRSSIFHSRPVHSLMLSSHRFPLLLTINERMLSDIVGSINTAVDMHVYVCECAGLCMCARCMLFINIAKRIVAQCRMLLVGCWGLTSQQHASESQGLLCSDKFTCCHTEIEVADQTFYHNHSQYTITGPTSPSADPILQAPGRVATGVQSFKSLV